MEGADPNRVGGGGNTGAGCGGEFGGCPAARRGIGVWREGGPAPGVYTAVVDGSAGAEGVALVEVYAVGVAGGGPVRLVKPNMRRRTVRRSGGGGARQT